jgi:DNA invertase Pin-like site-specific DNA recombinase
MTVLGGAMHCIIYDRISQDRDGEGANVEIRLNEDRDYVADQQGWSIIAERSDNDIPASRDRKTGRMRPRPGYQDVLRIILEYTGSVPLCVVTTEMERLYRDMQELLDLIKLAEGDPPRTMLKRIQCTDGNFYDLSTGQGVHAAIGAVNNAMLEVRKLSDRTKRKKRARAMKGAWGGSRYRPFGIAWTPTYYDDKGRPRGYKLELDLEEVAWIHEAYDRLEAGWTRYMLCKDWHERKIKTPAGNRWQPEELKDMLLAPRLTGVRRYHGVDYEPQPGIVGWPQIVTPERQEGLRDILSHPKRSGLGANHGKGRVHLLTGWVYCGRPECGAKLVCVPNQGKLRYVCMKGCMQVGRTAAPVDELIRQAIFYVLDHEALRVGLENTDADDRVERDLDEEITEIKRKRAVNKRRWAIDQTMSDEDYAWAEDELGPREEELRATLARLRQPRRTLAIVKERGPQLRQAWENEGLGFRHSLIDLLFERITILPSDVTGRRIFDPTKIVPTWKPIVDQAKLDVDWFDLAPTPPPPRQCSFEGCEEPHQAHGFCGKHYQCWRRCGQPTRPAKQCAEPGCEVCFTPRGPEKFCSAHNWPNARAHRLRAERTAA